MFNKSANSALVFVICVSILSATTLPSSLPSLFCVIFKTSFANFWSTAALFKSPVNKVSSKVCKKFFLSFTDDALNTFLNSGKTLSTSWSILATFSSAKFTSLISLAFWVFFASATSIGFLPLNLNADANLSKPCASLELSYASSLPLFASAFAARPVPYTKGVRKTDSAPNLNLFIKLLAASSLPPSLSNLSNAVTDNGSKTFGNGCESSNKSPIVPIFSTSATKVSPPAPPKTTAANLCFLDNLFNCLALSTPFLTFGDFRLTSLPAFFACIALVAKVVASLAPAAPGIPIWTNASVSLPTALSSAISSKGFNLSKNASTCAAVSVSAPRSMSSAPKDTTPSTVFIRPEAAPAANAVKLDTSLFFSADGESNSK